MILYIDTSDFNNVTFSLVGKAVFTKSYTVNPHESHEILKMLQVFLKKHQITKNKIQKIIVNKGPGSYTGVRIGVVMAQAFSFAWGIPMQALEKSKFEKQLGKYKM